MGSDVSEVVEVLENSSGVKVHSSMCSELIKILNKIVDIFPAIESTHPGGRSGIQELCSLNNAIEKAKLLLQHCAESSKLYLAITGESVLLRCERIRSNFNHSLCQIQDMVPVSLAAQIDEILNSVRDAKFTIDSMEEQAGKVMLELLRQTDSTKESELQAFQIAALRLNITSPKVLLVERRSIRKLLDGVRDKDSKKEKILSYLLYLLKEYGKKVVTDANEQIEILNAECKSSNTTSAYDAGSSDNNSEPTEHGDACVALHSSDNFPEEFRCPISSKLMYDPVVIASGQTYERVWIEKWFKEGNDTCPKTQKKLANFSVVPNSCMKDLILKWCKEHGVSIQDACGQPKPAAFSYWEASCCSSISSLRNVSALLLDGRTGDYMLQSDHSNASFVSSDASYCSDSSHVKGIESFKDSSAQMFSWSDDYKKYYTVSSFNQDMYLKFLYQLSQLPIEAQGKALQELNTLIEDDATCHVMLSNGFMEALMSFLKNAYDLTDVQAQKTAAQILLAFLSYVRADIPALGEDAFQLLVSLFESEIAVETLLIMHKLSRHLNYISNIVASGALASIVKFLDSENVEFQEVAVMIFCEISFHGGFRSHIFSTGCILKIIPLLGNRRLAECCIKFLQNLTDMEEVRAMIAQTNGCIASIVELLEVGNQEEQEHGVVILHSLCSNSSGNCQLVMNEGVIPALVTISVNGNPKGKEFSMKLLNILRDLRNSDCLESSQSHSESNERSESDSEAIKCSESSYLESESKPEPVEEHNSSSNKRQPRSSSTGFFARKMKFFSKPRSLALV